MAVTKVTLYFELLTTNNGKAGGNRLAGWTESWYYPGDVGNAMLFAAAGNNCLCALRAKCLPRSGQIVAQRYQIVDTNPPGNSTLRNVVFPGGQWETDIPSMSLLVSVPTNGSRNVKRFQMRGIPDQFVQDGEYTPDPVFSKAATTFFNSLNNWRFRGIDYNSPKTQVDTVNLLGICQLIGGVVPAVGSTVSYFAGKDSVTFQAIRLHNYVVSASNPGLSQITLRGWSTAHVAIGGFVRPLVYTYPQPSTDDILPERITTRRVGRPLDGFRGRSRRGQKTRV